MKFVFAESVEDVLNAALEKSKTTQTPLKKKNLKKIKFTSAKKAKNDSKNTSGRR
jgi:hypothetical protein